MKTVLLISVALFCTSVAEAGSVRCFERAAALAGVDEDVLVAMAWVESRWNPQAVNRGNRNGSEDVCLMQINSVHFSRLSRIGVTRKQLLSNWCVCLLTGATILGEMRAEIDGDLWSAVAAYNAGPGNVAGGRQYAERVRATLDILRNGRSK